MELYLSMFSYSYGFKRFDNYTLSYLIYVFHLQQLLWLSGSSCVGSSRLSAVPLSVAMLCIFWVSTDIYVVWICNIIYIFHHSQIGKYYYLAYFSIKPKQVIYLYLSVSALIPNISHTKDIVALSQMNRNKQFYFFNRVKNVF